MAFDNGFLSVTIVSFGQSLSRVAVSSAVEEECVMSFAGDIIARLMTSVINKSQRWPAIKGKRWRHEVATECRGCAANPTCDR